MHLKNFYRQKLERYAQIRQDFFYTVLPRTQHKAENFSLEILKNHIIVCGIGLNLKNLLMPLRASSMRNHQYPIVIMDKKEHIPIEIWKEIEYYPDVYYMQGNPMKSRDLQKAGIKKAKAVIILSKSTSNNEGSNLVDMDTIFIYKAIQNETKSIMIIAELISVSALSFLNSEDNDENIIKEQGYWLSPSFAVGEIFIGSMLDTLMCQAFYNPFITNIIKQLIMGSAGSNYSINFQNKLNDKKISQSTLYLLPIKDELVRLGIRDIQKTIFYRELFDIFLKNNMIPIGLYRNSNNFFFEETNQSYVYMCPSKDDLVDTNTDKIYLLANERSFTIVKQRREKVRRTSSYIPINTASKLIDKSNELTLNLVQKMKKLVSNGNQKLRNNFSINKVTNNVRESFRNELNNIYDDLVEDKKEAEEDKK
jgi:potassium large conductance calcium-activated channel subfamily M alpha protein 1